MPRNGSGSYLLPAGNPVIPGTTITSTWGNTTMSDIGAALTQSIANDGQTVPVANLPMATFRHTNVGNAVARTDYAAAAQVQDSQMVWLTSVAGTNTITASLAVPPLAAYVSGQTFRFVAANTNTGATTININGLGAKNLTKNGTTPVGAGDIVSGAVHQITYDGTQFQLSTSSNGALYRSIGLLGVIGTPSSVQASFAAGGIILWSPSTRTSVTVGNTTSITNDITVGGPTANGRDQAGAFPAATTVHFYFIWNGTAVATISSLSTPDIGPVFPTGYTHWAYIGAVTTVASALRVVVARGSWFNFTPNISALSTISLPIADAAVSTAGIIPTNCLNYTINMRGTVNSGPGGAYNSALFVKLASGGSATDEYHITTAGPASLGTLYGFSLLPYFSSSFFYVVSNAVNLSATSYTINLHSYQMPNGS